MDDDNARAPTLLWFLFVSVLLSIAIKCKFLPHAENLLQTWQFSPFSSFSSFSLAHGKSFAAEKCLPTAFSLSARWWCCSHARFPPALLHHNTHMLMNSFPGVFREFSNSNEMRTLFMSSGITIICSAPLLARKCSEKPPKIWLLIAVKWPTRVRSGRKNASG